MSDTERRTFEVNSVLIGLLNRNVNAEYFEPWGCNRFPLPSDKACYLVAGISQTAVNKTLDDMYSQYAVVVSSPENRVEFALEDGTLGFRLLSISKSCAEDPKLLRDVLFALKNLSLISEVSELVREPRVNIARIRDESLRTILAKILTEELGYISRKQVGYFTALD